MNENALVISMTAIYIIAVLAYMMGGGDDR